MKVFIWRTIAERVPVVPELAMLDVEPPVPGAQRHIWQENGDSVSGWLADIESLEELVLISERMRRGVIVWGNSSTKLNRDIEVDSCVAIEIYYEQPGAFFR